MPDWFTSSIRTWLSKHYNRQTISFIFIPIGIKIKWKVFFLNILIWTLSIDIIMNYNNIIIGKELEDSRYTALHYLLVEWNFYFECIDKEPAKNWDGYSFVTISQRPFWFEIIWICLNCKITVNIYCNFQECSKFKFIIFLW